jgi:hypothetical protein
MSGPERHADFAVRLETTDARPVTGARVYDDEWAFFGIDLTACGRAYTREYIVDGPFQGSPVDHELYVIIQHVWGMCSQILVILVTALPKHVREQYTALCEIDYVIDSLFCDYKRHIRQAGQSWIQMAAAYRII